MLRSFFVFITISILISGCTPALQATPQPDQPTTTSSPLSTATPTRTALPTATPTASITPLPTIPTFTPTYDVSTIVTVTPAPKAECPKENANVFPINMFPQGDEPYDDSFINRIIEFLNNGGTSSSLNFELNKTNKRIDFYGNLHSKDITNDGIPELLIKLYESYFILKCDHKQYVIIYSLERSFIGSEINIKDLNQNSMPDIMVSIDPCADRFCPEIWILEWDEINMNSLLHITGDVKSISDVNGDGLNEITVIKYPNYREFEATDRAITSIYAWNGLEFIRKSYDGEEKYRFQAIQDADIAILYGNYDIALVYYQDAIFSDNLQWWSKERRDYEEKIFYDAYNLITPEPMQYPIEDTTEYPRLAAYAYYRIMLLHLVQGHESDAATIYNTLQKKFGNDPSGQPYVEMATAFWNAYQSTHTMYAGCAAAIQYAVEHPAILTPLGSDYHGTQSHIYKPEDVCPFR